MLPSVEPFSCSSLSPRGDKRYNTPYRSICQHLFSTFLNFFRGWFFALFRAKCFSRKHAAHCRLRPSWRAATIRCSTAFIHHARRLWLSARRSADLVSVSRQLPRLTPLPAKEAPASPNLRTAPRPFTALSSVQPLSRTHTHLFARSTARRNVKTARYHLPCS